MIVHDRIFLIIFFLNNLLMNAIRLFIMIICLCLFTDWRSKLLISGHQLFFNLTSLFSAKLFEIDMINIMNFFRFSPLSLLDNRRILLFCLLFFMVRVSFLRHCKLDHSNLNFKKNYASHLIFESK